MTEQEAIKNLKNLFSEHELCLPCTDSLETLQTAIEAIEKQIPKKPKESVLGVYCSECKHFLDGTEYHCQFCGQALDWSVEE